MPVKKKTPQKAVPERTLRSFVPRVVVKFANHIEIPYREGAEQYLEKSGLKEWKDISAKFPGLKLVPLFKGKGIGKIKQMLDTAVELDENYKAPNFLTYFAIDCYGKIDPHELAKELKRIRLVEHAYVEGGPTPPPAVNPADDPRYPNQGYLDPAPDGIDAEYAWGFTGGDGAGLDFVDLERGWTLNHEDLNAAGITIISGINTDYFGHGTAVLGEVRAVDNNIGCVGIAPNVTARVVSQWRSGGSYNTADAILDAVAVLNFGDVLLLEAQTSSPYATGYCPVEVELAVYDAIRLGTALGVVIVEAGGNGTVDLDAFNDATYGNILDRSSGDFRDSGAIMVGAGSSAAPHTRMGFSNYGSRIDCYGWGENINTTGDGWTGNLTTTYTTSFGGTSGASPIVTGAALIVQGIAEASLGYRFSPRQLREILSDPANGTASNNPATDEIGVMPDLKFIIDNLINVSPDIYIRDYVGDGGDPHTSGSISASPDVIVLPSTVANPQASFGEGSGTENSNTLGHEAEFGQNNYIYVRVRNRGGSNAANVNAEVYWSEVASLVTPNLWNYIGTVTIPSVPTGDILTVSDAIVWGSVPAEGHYCFVGLVGNAQDPAPGPADFGSWNNFYTFIRNNNNVTWRNFNVVNIVPPGAPPPAFVELPFLLTGAHDKARVFEFEIIGKLPRGSKVMLHVPFGMHKLLADVSPYMKVYRKYVQIPVKPFGVHKLKRALLPANLKAKCSLNVRIPKEYLKREYEIAFRQIYERVEVGRVTWRLSPNVQKPKKGKKK